MTTFNEMFENPAPEIANEVASERATGLDEAELALKGLIEMGGTPPGYKVEMGGTPPDYRVEMGGK